MSDGRVYLVGAGPGDPELISLRAVECLRRADLVLYDGLVNPLVLRHTSAACERTCRSAGSDGKRLDQAEINSRLVEAARSGRTVVRLKGGDPFIFGRGGEEAAALAAAGIPFEVVPGVTAAVAAAEYAGISLTHRELASAVAFVTGHEDPAKEASHVDYALLARFDGTLVFYMGLHRLESIVRALIEHGKPADTPACVVSRGTLPQQQTVTAPLSELAAAVRAADLHPPSLIVVGDCVAQRRRIAWFEQRPLFGCRIGITRPAAQAEPQIARCLELGGEPVLMPTIRIEPPDDFADIDAALGRLNEYDWLIFTSVNGVHGLLQRLWDTGGDARRIAGLKIAAIGPGTAAALEEHRLRPDVVPDEYRAEALADALADAVDGRRILWAGANRGREVLPERLQAAGANVEKLVAYCNFDVDSWPRDVTAMLAEDRLDWIGLSSPSIAENLARLLPKETTDRLASGKSRLRFAAISPVTAEAAERSGLSVNAVAERYTWDGVFDAIAASTADE